MEQEIKRTETEDYTVIVKKKPRKASTQRKRKKKGFFASVERFLEKLADAGNVDAYEREFVSKYSKNKNAK